MTRMTSIGRRLVTGLGRMSRRFRIGRRVARDKSRTGRIDRMTRTGRIFG